MSVCEDDQAFCDELAKWRQNTIWVKDLRCRIYGFRLCCALQQPPLVSAKRVDVTLSSDSEDEQPGMKTAAPAASGRDGAGDGKSGKRQLTASPVKTQWAYSIQISSEGFPFYSDMHYLWEQTFWWIFLSKVNQLHFFIIIIIIQEFPGGTSLDQNFRAAVLSCNRLVSLLLPLVCVASNLLLSEILLQFIHNFWVPGNPLTDGQTNKPGKNIPWLSEDSGDWSRKYLEWLTWEVIARVEDLM